MPRGRGHSRSFLSVLLWFFLFVEAKRVASLGMLFSDFSMLRLGGPASATGIFTNLWNPLKQTPHKLIPKLFGPLRERYQDRPGGYTRVLRIEPPKPDQAPSAILELVDGPKDMRFAMTARAVARQRTLDDKRDEAGEMPRGINEITLKNVKKVTKYREGGQQALESLVKRFESMGVGKEEGPARSAAR